MAASKTYEQSHLRFLAPSIMRWNQTCPLNSTRRVCRFLKGRRFPGKVKLTRADVAEANVSQDFSRMAVTSQDAQSSGQVPSQSLNNQADP